MKFRIECDEKYPFMTLEPPLAGDGPNVEISEEEHADYLRVMREFYAWQQRLDTLGWGGPGGIRR